VPFIAAAGLGILSLSLPAGAADLPSASEHTTAAQRPALALPPGFEAKELKGESGIKSALVKLTETAVTKGDWNKFLGELSKQDKERAREFKGADQARLDGIIDQIQREWKGKYGQEFSIDDKNLIFNQQFAFVQGEVSDPATAVSNWPAPAIAGEAVTAGSHTNAGDVKKEEKEAKLTKGRNVAVVRFPMSHEVPEITVSMIHHLPASWRVDVPNDRTGEQIYNDLVNRLTFIRDHQDHWPNDVNDGYRMVAHHVVAALYGVGLPTEASKG